MEVLRMENVSFSYAGAEKKVLENISFAVNEGEFVVLCGKTGCGKTTLLRLLKKELKPHGTMNGNIFYAGGDMDSMSERDSAKQIGYVMQKPEQQIVTDKVWHELAFGLENLGVPQEKIRRRVCEMASYFGISNWFYKDVWELSGGQKQLLNLASVMAMNPRILLLDEPTSQLDPIAASEFIQTLQKLNREFGLTIFMIEHRLEEVYPIADRIIVLDEGEVFANGTPRKVLLEVDKREDLMEAMPAAARFYHAFHENAKHEYPLTIKEGKEFVETHFKDNVKMLLEQKVKISTNIVLELKNVFFRYEKNGQDILKETSFEVREHEVFCILGANGSGKTTTLSVAAGLLKPYTGKVEVFGKRLSKYKREALYNGILAFLPQDVSTVFLKETVCEDWMEAYGCSKEELPSKLKDNPVVATKILNVDEVMEKHPYDLSGGQQQICAMIKLLAKQPKILLLDEPTKGMDAYAKAKIRQILGKLKETMSLVIVTHDIEFAAVVGDRCGMFFCGEMISNDVPSKFFSENTFYTTAANRMTRNRYENVVTIEEAVAICKTNGFMEGD